MSLSELQVYDRFMQSVKRIEIRTAADTTLWVKPPGVLAVIEGCAEPQSPFKAAWMAGRAFERGLLEGAVAGEAA